MSIEEYKNIEDIKNQKTLVTGRTISDGDIELLKLEDKTIDYGKFDFIKTIIEFTVYETLNQTALRSHISNVKSFIEKYNYINDLKYSIEDYIYENNNSLYFKEKNFFNTFYPELFGSFQYNFNFLKQDISNDDFNELVLYEISPSRTECRIKYIKNDNRINFNDIYKNIDTDVSVGDNIFINFGNNNLSHVINIFVESEDSVIYKTYDGLPDAIEEKNTCYICKKIVNSYVKFIEITPPRIPIDEDLISLLPNFDIPVNKTFNLKTTHKNLNDLTTINTKSNVLGFLSSSSDDLKFDYNEYDNYVFYSSATRRLENFKYKLLKIEDYKSDISINSSLSQSLEVVSSSIKSEISIDTIKNTFTPYEKYLYYESSSYSTGSLGEFYERTFPKSNNTKPYNLYSISSSAAINWYNKEIISSSLFDNRNLNYLRNTVPLFIREDSSNDEYLKFVDMIGEFFDEIYFYIKNLSNKKINELTKDKGMSNVILNSLINQYGSELFEEFGNANIQELFLNYDSVGNFVTSSINPLPIKDQKNILYKKFINNLIYFLKTKGTINNIHALANMFGISRDYYEIREYGGKDLTFSQYSTQSIQDSSVEYLNLEYSLRFSGNQNAKILWKDNNAKKSDSIIFKFKLNNSTSASISQSLFESPGKFAVVAYKSGSLDNFGILKFLLSGSSGIKSASLENVPIFNNQFWNIMVQRSVSTSLNSVNQVYSLKANSIVFDRINHYTSSYLNITGGLTSSYNASFNQSGDFYIGGTLPTSSFLQCAPFNGNVSDLKFYNVVLRDDIFKKQSLSQALVVSNDVSSSFDDLVTHLKFDDNKNLFITNSLYDSNFSTYGKNHATASGFSSNSFESRFEKSIFKSKTASLVNPTTTKVRITTNQSSGSDGLIFLATDTSIESSSYSKYGEDSKKLSLIFSSANIENKDIMTFFDFDIQDFVGDPKMLFDDVESYTDLENLNKIFRQIKSKVNIHSYIENIQKLTRTFFKNLDNFIGARVDFRGGISIEPNILERTNVVLNKSVKITKPNYSTILPELSPTSSAKYILHSVVLKEIAPTSSAHYFLHSVVLKEIAPTSSAHYFLHKALLSVADTSITSTYNILSTTLGKNLITITPTYCSPSVANLLNRNDRIFIQGPKRKIIKESYVTSSNGPNFYNYFSTGSVFETATITPILPCSDYKYIYTYSTASNQYVISRNSAVTPKYDANYNSYYESNHVRYFYYNSLGNRRSKYLGTLNTGPEHPLGATTVDGKKVVEITFVSPNTLTVSSIDEDKARLKVDGTDLSI